MPAYCSKCGAKLAPGSRFCPGCGVKIAATTHPPARKTRKPPAK